ncbi:MAG: DUF58 domain-containing protein [Planctomycetota bacterium]|nr:DUF58 domain-containing protein [Planctomycetota bacterium]
MPRLDLPQSLKGLRQRLQQRLLKPEEADRPPREVLRPEFLAGLKRLDLRARALVQGFLQGLHRSPRRGFSVEFSDYRNFVAGDDPRWIDWRLYARTDRLFVKRYEAESATRATLVLDASASMGYRSEKRGSFAAPAFSKLGYAVTLAAAFAYLLQHQRDRVGLLCAGGASGGAYLPPRSSRQHVQRVLENLSALRAEGDADIAAALSGLAAQDRRRGLIVVFTDALTGRARLLDALKRLRHRGHELVLFQVWDPAELDPPATEGLSFRDPETGARRDPLPHPEYVARARGHLAEIRRGCLAVPAEFQFLLNTSPFDRALYKFLRLRRRRH